MAKRSMYEVNLFGYDAEGHITDIDYLCGEFKTIADAIEFAESITKLTDLVGNLTDRQIEYIFGIDNLASLQLEVGKYSAAGTCIEVFDQYDIEIK